MHSLRHKSAMRSPHVCYVIQACDGQHNRKHRFRSTCAPAPPSQFRNALDQSARRMSPSCSAESSWAHHLHNNGPFHHITDASHQKYYYIWIRSFAIGSFFILKYRLTLKKFILFILHLVQFSSELFHLHFHSSLCLKISTTIFISKTCI